MGMSSAIPLTLNTWLHRSRRFETHGSVVDVEFEVGTNCNITGLGDGQADRQGEILARCRSNSH